MKNKYSAFLRKSLEDLKEKRDIKRFVFDKLVFTGFFEVLNELVEKNKKLEFEKNLVTFDSIMLHHTENEDATIRLMNAKDKNYTLETLDSLYLKTIYNYNFDPSRGIYNSLINSGQIELLSNETLKYKIAEIQDIVVDYIDDENLARHYGIDVVIPLTVNQMPYNPLRFYKNRSSEEKDKHYKLFREMINNRIFIEHLSILSLYLLGEKKCF